MGLPAFYRGIAAQLRAGRVLSEALAAVPSATPDVASVVADGEPLSQALGRHPERYPEGDRALIAAGEETGRLDPVLDRLADLHDERRAQIRRLVGLSLYPLMIFHVAALCIPIGLGGLAGRFSIGSALVSWFITVSIFWAIVIAVVLACRRADLRARLGRALALVPLFGSARRHGTQATFTLTLEAAYEAGMPLDRAVALAGRAADLPATPASSALAAGNSLATTLPGLLDRALVDRIAAAESAGELTPELRRIAAEETEIARRRYELAVSAVAKGFYVLMVLAILVYALAILSPLHGLL